MAKTISEIRQTLKIEERTFRRYISKINTEDKKIWYDIVSQELEGELLRLRSCLNNSYNIAKKMSEDETAHISERLEACQAANDCRLSLVQILREYDEFKTQRKIPTSSKNLETVEESINLPSTFKRIH